MTTVTLTGRRPCCGRPSRFAALAAVPTERYTRRCLPCETTWSVERRLLSSRAGARLDRLVWLDTRAAEHVKLYGAPPRPR
jgi:hypothetical protein